MEDFGYAMESFDGLVFFLCIFLTFLFLVPLYRAISNHWPPEYKAGRSILGALPPVALVVITLTLTTLASFDVVGSMFYILFYIVMGFAWVYFGVFIMRALFDISWADDILNMNNSSALCAFTGGFLGVTLIYSAANIGDGPGWWCVVFAGGLGTITWAGLALLLNWAAGVFERVTVERDISCGIRFGCYLLASAILLGRASAGDWTSAGATIVEFLAGWPVLPLTALAIAVERFYRLAENNESSTAVSALWGALFIVVAVLCVMLLPPMIENPIYSNTMPSYQ